MTTPCGDDSNRSAMLSSSRREGRPSVGGGEAAPPLTLRLWAGDWWRAPGDSIPPSPAAEAESEGDVAAGAPDGAGDPMLKNWWAPVLSSEMRGPRAVIAVCGGPAPPSMRSVSAIGSKTPPGPKVAEATAPKSSPPSSPSAGWVACWCVRGSPPPSSVSVSSRARIGGRLDDAAGA